MENLFSNGVQNGNSLSEESPVLSENWTLHRRPFLSDHIIDIDLVVGNFVDSLSVDEVHPLNESTTLLARGVIVPVDSLLEQHFLLFLRGFLFQLPVRVNALSSRGNGVSSGILLSPDEVILHFHPGRNLKDSRIEHCYLEFFKIIVIYHAL